MIVPGSANALLLSQSGYTVPYSLRFRYSNNASLSRTGVVTPTNDKIFTWSGWVKLGLAVTNNADYGVLFTGYTGNSDAGYGVITISNPIAGFPALRVGGWSTNWRITSAAFRDPSAWYHIVVAIDTTNATAGDRIKIYVNGTQITSFGTSNNPSLNSTVGMNNASTAQRLGLDAPASSAYHFDGYMAEVNFIDGQALTPSSFGQTDAATGVWVPKKYSGTYGTNGFYLKFADASAATATAIGKDSSGNSNNWTPSGISVTSGVTFDQMADTPTLDYCVLNPLQKYQVTLSNANMSMSVGNAYPNNVRSTFTLSSGKWYWEATVNSASGVHNRGFSLTKDDFNVAGGAYSSSSNPGAGWTWDSSSDNRILVNGSSVTNTLAIPATNDVLMLAYDADTRKVWFGKNGTWNNSGNPGSGTNESGTISSGSMTPTLDAYGTSNSGFDVNFGQRAFAYTPPTGFKALNTANLPTPSIKKGSLYMDATLRTGTGATASVSSLGFQPDLVWIKSRSAATNHNLFDSSRGAQKGFNSNVGGPEYTDANSLTAFNSSGYSLGSDASSRGVNINTNTYVDWAWKEGATPGFDVVTYTGNATNRTISHSLGAVPAMMIIKNVDYATGVPVVYHKMYNGGVNPANYYMYLSSTSGIAATAAFFNNTQPTSSVFTVGTDTFVNANSNNIVAYLWSEIEGFSKFGSYTGNGSTDGPFVWCGFRPRYILAKRTDVANDWCIADSARPAFNPAYNLRANLADVEDTTQYNTDLLSNGFKVRNTTNGMNASGGTYIFAAFAENPFKYSRAR
jgi:hypothetical protein